MNPTDQEIEQAVKDLISHARVEFAKRELVGDHCPACGVHADAAGKLLHMRSCPHG